MIIIVIFNYMTPVSETLIATQVILSEATLQLLQLLVSTIVFLTRQLVIIMNFVKEASILITFNMALYRVIIVSVTLKLALSSAVPMEYQDL